MTDTNDDTMGSTANDNGDPTWQEQRHAASYGDEQIIDTSDNTGETDQADVDRLTIDDDDTAPTA